MLSLQRGIDMDVRLICGQRNGRPIQNRENNPMHSRTVETGWCAVTPATHLKHRAN